MKKWIAILTAAVLALSLFAGCTSSDSKGMTIEKGKLIMSTNAEFPPYEMTDDNGSYVGIDIVPMATIWSTPSMATTSSRGRIRWHPV